MGIHLGGIHVDFIVVLALSAIAAAVLFGLGIVAYRRRRSRAYLLVTLALAVLVARPVVGALSATALVPAETHHLLEHSFDAILLVLLLAAIYYGRFVAKKRDGGNV